MRRSRRRVRLRTPPISFSAIPWNPLSNTPLGKNISAGAELFERMTRRYGKPTFGLDEIEVDGVAYPVLEDVVWSRPFCNLLHFVRPDFPRRRRTAEDC